MRQIGYFELEIAVIEKQLENALGVYGYYDSRMDSRSAKAFETALALIEDLGSFSGSKQALGALDKFCKRMTTGDLNWVPNELIERVKKNVLRVKDPTRRPLKMVAPDESSAHYRILIKKMEKLNPQPAPVTNKMLTHKR